MTIGKERLTRDTTLSRTPVKAFLQMNREGARVSMGARQAREVTRVWDRSSAVAGDAC